MWRLLQDPGFLFSQLFKNMYYVNGHILIALCESLPSYAWRCILFGRELIVKGLK